MYSTVKGWNGCAPVNVNGGSSFLVKDGVLDARRVARVEVVAETVVHAVVPVGRLSQLLCEILICEPQRYTLYIELEVKVQFSGLYSCVERSELHKEARHSNTQSIGLRNAERTEGQINSTIIRINFAPSL